MRDAREVVRDAPRLASLPSHYLRCRRLADDPHANNADLASVLAEDPSLVARVLRLVNSAAFGRSQPIETIGQALAVAGTRQVLDLALATTVLRTFPGIPEQEVTLEDFWRHSLGVAVAAHLLAERRGGVSPERCFTVGLLHDIGRLVLLLHEPLQARRAFAVAREDDMPLVDAERATIGFDHAAVGEELLRHWSLPESLAVPVGAHHQPSRAGLFAEEAAIVHVADAIANALGFGANGRTHLAPLDADAVARVAPAHGDLPVLLDEVESRHADLVQVMLVFDHLAGRSATAGRIPA